MRSVKSRRRQQIFRAIAILFLFYTGIDLAFPQLCCEEPPGLATEQVAAPATEIITGESWIAPISSAQSGQDQPDDIPCRDEDCFCCCTHVMPSPPFIPSFADSNQVSSIHPNIFITSATLKTPYHPPRFA